MLSACLSAQTVTVTVTAHDEVGGAVEGAIVKIVDGNKTLAFGSTDAKGAATLHAECHSTKVHLTVKHLSYAPVDRLIDAKTQHVDMTLSSSSLQLREVVVKAPPVRQKGDTLKFNLGSFTGKGDVTLEDGLKKLPGIAVSKEGTISYMGKDISEFKIEGLDLLGGKYNLATRNIHAKDAATVEVLRHHHRNKIDKSAFSDDVALNVRLTEKAKNKYFVTYDGGVGCEPHTLLYKVGLTGMTFRAGRQSISTAKVENVNGGMGSYELIDHFGTSHINSLAESALGDFGNTSPAVETRRYMKGTNGQVSVNNIHVLAPDRTLEANIDYSYKKNDYDYRTTSRYYADKTQNLVIDEEAAPHHEEHAQSVSLNYRSDRAAALVENTLKMNSRFEHAMSNLSLGGSRIGQHRTLQLFDVFDTFSSQRQGVKKRFNYNAIVRYTVTPTDRLDFIRQSEDSTYLQRAQSRTFFAAQSTEFVVSLTSTGKVYLPVTVEYTYNGIRTMLFRAPSVSVNDLYGSKVRIPFEPRYELTSPTQKYNLKLSASLYYLLMDYHAADRQQKIYLHRLYLDPKVMFHYQMSGLSDVTFTSLLEHSTGDLLDLLIHPVQTNYRSQSASSGILAKSRIFSSDIDYRYQLPLQYLFFNATASYSSSKTNLLSAQYVSDDATANSFVYRDNRSDAASFTANISKNILPIATKMTLTFSYRWNRQHVVQQNTAFTYFGRMYATNFNVTSGPVDWIELTYDLSVDKMFNRYGTTKSSILEQRHDGEIAYYPTDNVKLFSSVSYRHNEIGDGRYKNITFFDAGCQYKTKKGVWKLSLDNLFNVRRYRYTVFGGVNSFAYDYLLRGRSIMLTFLLR
jgi:hypothetical protein